jgi:signal transduction histidine kinase
MSDWRKNRDPTFQDQADIGKKHDFLLERDFMALINIPSALILLILHNDENVAYYFAAVHVPQFVGNLGAVLILCRKLVPEYFTSVNILGAQFSLAFGITLAFAMFGQSSGYLFNVLVIVSMIINIYFIFIRILRPWFMDLGNRVLFGEESITISELCALWYFLSALFIAVLVPMALAVRGGFNMANSDLYDVCTLVFSFSLFGIITNTIPGHLAKNAVEREKKKSLKTKETMVRYMGHEVRSPLHVLVSGLRILKADIVKLQLSLEDQAILMDTVESRKCLHRMMSYHYNHKCWCLTLSVPAGHTVIGTQLTIENLRFVNLPQLKFADNTKYSIFIKGTSVD